ncbi:P110/LppT family adhesin N-terminal domain [Mesomycoplasma ovipneumoniae]|uniref:P110/LppT family adhesin N-terminal domain n=1 Tax=Mesomycoplasma ovipneumoniae TaxID=29562 RepID=A0AAW6Q668_9BACT|nr:P110/LppT family adhesin N-terminal domain [Mesomycoplasma ovipneumoniae]MDF9627941.1 P110/LppT family adhesin N-terminal domain [Mesomycoplasma ovipneumoniae]MDO4157974.1 P110/LppT family adhesin N-terminal domain [Mesomycoplasma ovipneumoniae]MDO4158131.1 P110/LppT family adhesin N-terminal domain [Mesomycoplasma ovipneumoniae]MDO6822044.1 P110/LppT family adhesin N-terminal domain [Mesomycoplasma ovipneumoniae]MDO6855705.1 P110/LppT family adhesin N-terminal domain [Mesomycoplasma ovipne
MKLLKKPFWLVSTILGSAIALSAVIGIPLGLKAYNNSYYSFLNESPTEHALANTGSVSSEQFSTIVSNLKLNPNIANISAKTALAAAKSRLYQFDLSSAFDFGDLKSKDYQISFNFENAVADGTSIKNVVVFARSEKEQITYSKQIELKGFAASDQASGDLDKFQVDESKSFIDVSRSNLLQKEFQTKLTTNFQKSTRIVNNFSKLEGTLASSGASLSLYNSLDEPIFLDSDYSLEAVIDSKNQLSFTEKDKKLFLDVNLVNKKDNKTKKLSLEIRGLIDPDEFKSTLSTWLENHFSGNIKMKEDLQDALIKDKTTLVDFLYNKKSGTDTEKIITKPVSELFEIDLSQLSPRTKFGTFDLKIEPKLFDATKISQADQQKLLKDKKVRFEFDINFSRQDSELEQKITLYLDVFVDLNKYEQALGQLLGSVNSVQEFSLKDQTGPRTLSTNEIKETVDQLFELAKTESNLEEPSNDVVTRVFLLDNGRFPTRSEINKSKNELKKVIQEAKAKASSISSQSVNVSNFNEEESSAGGGLGSESGNGTNSDSASGAGSTPAPKIGTNVWTTLNTASIYNLSDAKVEYQIEVKEDHQLVFDFQLVSTNDDSKVLASSQIVVNNVINSEKSAYDVIKKYNPSLFLDPISLENTEKDGKVNLFDPENKNLTFHSEQARRTADGLELTKPLKFQDIQPKAAEAEATKTEATKTEATKTEAAKLMATKTEATKTEATKPKVTPKPFSRLDSGALYLAFSAKGISDGKQHYLLSDKDGKGIFIQKLEAKEGEKPVYVIGMDYKQLANYVYLKQSFGSKKLGISAYTQLFGGSTDLLRVLDKQQVLVTSGISRKNTTQGSNHSTNSQLKPSLYLHNSWDGFALFPTNPPKMLYEKTEIFLGKTTPKPTVPTINDTANNVYYSQSFYSPKEETDVTKNKNLIEEDANLLLEIIKTPFSITLSLYSSNAEDPKNYKEVGDVIYNIDPSKTWNPFPNYFNLDWDQIGPVEAKPAEPATKKPVAEQTPESGKSQSTITLKAFAVFDHPDFTRGKTSRARQEITEAFIDAYIKK